MNTKELIEAIQTRLRAAVWTGGKPVFASASVVISAGVPEEFYEKYQMPQAHIGVGGMQADPDSHPRLISQEIPIRLVVEHTGDGHGEAALVGANRVANQSRRAGLLEIEEELMDTIALLTNDESVNILLRASTAAQAVRLPDNRYVVVRDYVFTARITTMGA